MTILVIESAPRRIVGFCSSWGLQIASGVYVANLPARHRELVWERIVGWATRNTKVTMVWPSPKHEQRLDFRTLGEPRRRLVAREGLVISTWVPRLEEENRPVEANDVSN